MPESNKEFIERVEKYNKEAPISENWDTFQKFISQMSKDYVEALNRLEQATEDNERLKGEKKIRIKYQDIVFRICAIFDAGCVVVKPCISDEIVKFTQVAVGIARQHGLSQALKGKQ